jgi:hypothetical protein
MTANLDFTRTPLNSRLMPGDVQYRASRAQVAASKVPAALSPVAKAPDAAQLSQEADELRALGQE